MLRVGLTGGIACGKSLVLGRLASAGLKTLDLDGLAHTMLEPGGKAHDAVLRAFGEDVRGTHGSIDRKALGAIVFSDPAARERLNAIVHPRVSEEEARLASVWEAEGNSLLVTDAALLVEAGMHLRFDRLAVVYCSPEEQLARLLGRDHLSESEARARIDAQMPVAEKREFAHYPLSTSGPREEAVKQADLLASELRILAAHGSPRRVELSLERASGALASGPSGPVELLEAIVERRGLEMGRLIPPPKLWYRGGWASQGEVEAFGVPLVLWTLARGGPDPSFLLAAAASVGRLFDGRAEPDLCLWSLFLLHLAMGRDLRDPLEQEWPGWLALSKRWGGAEPSRRVWERVVSAREQIENSALPPFGGNAVDAAVGLGVGLKDAPPQVQERVRRLRAAFP